MYYAIKTPSNSNTPPSKLFSPVGVLTDSQALDYDRQLHGSIQSFIAFDSKNCFDRFISNADDKFFSR